MSRLLNDLDYRFKNIAFQFLARLTEAGIPVMIITTLRTIEEQKQAVADKVSWTYNSKHLPQSPDGKSLAIDVCPFAQFTLHGTNKLMWDATDPAWQEMGKIGQALGLKWGVVKDGQRIDLGHFEWVQLSERMSKA
jgi:hypothetical protein